MPSKEDERNVCITAADGHTGFLIAELLLTNPDFSKQVDSVTALTLHPTSARAKELTKLGAHVVAHKPGRVKDMAKVLKDSGCNAICLIPPTHKDKFDVTEELVEATKQADVPNVLFMSSAGCDMAERDKQPRLREFIDLETMVMKTKGDTSTETGHSPVIIRAGFYAENLLLYARQAQKEGTLPIPIGDEHKFAPVSLGDVAQVAAHVLSGKGEHGFDDKHRGQLMVITGPMMMAGNELAEAASQALETKMEFENISEKEAKRVLHTQGHHDESERDYILEYYSLVREGKTNYVSTTAFVNVTGGHPQEPNDFFKVYAEEFTPKGKAKSKSDAKKEEEEKEKEEKEKAEKQQEEKEQQEQEAKEAKQKGGKRGASGGQESNGGKKRKTEE